MDTNKQNVNENQLHAKMCIRTLLYRECTNIEEQCAHCEKYTLYNNHLKWAKEMCFLTRYKYTTWTERCNM